MSQELIELHEFLTKQKNSICTHLEDKKNASKIQKAFTHGELEQACLALNKLEQLMKKSEASK